MEHVEMLRQTLGEAAWTGLVVVAVVAFAVGMLWLEHNWHRAREAEAMVQCLLLPDDVDSFTGEDMGTDDAASWRDTLRKGRVWADCPSWRGQIDRARRAYPETTFRLVHLPPAVRIRE